MTTPTLTTIAPDVLARVMLNPKTERLHKCRRTGSVVRTPGERALYSAETLCKRRGFFRLTTVAERRNYARCLVCEEWLS